MEFYDSLQEYALNNENYKKWREIHGKAFGKVFLSAFEELPDAQIHLTAALIKISNRDFNGGLEKLLELEQICFRDFDWFALSYFLGLCYEFLENEEKMNKYYEQMTEYDEEGLFLIAFHPFYRTAKFAQRKAENEKALRYYHKALSLYSENESAPEKLANMGQICVDLGTVYFSCQKYEKARVFLEKSEQYSPAVNPQRNYVTALLLAVEGKREASAKLVAGLPDFLKTACEQVIASL